MNDKDFEDMGISQVDINPHQNREFVCVCVHCNDCVIVHSNITLHISFKRLVSAQLFSDLLFLHLGWSEKNPYKCNY